MVPWYQGGPAYGHYADGYYGSYAMNGLFPAFLIGSMMGGLWSPAVIEPPADLGGDAAGGDWSTEGGGTDGLDSMDGIGEIGGGDHSGGDFSGGDDRSEEHTSELQSLMRISYAVVCLKKKHKL